MNLVNIAKGFASLAKSKLVGLPPKEQERVLKVMEMCSNCDLLKNNRCDSTRSALSIEGEVVKGCGCYLPAKVLTDDSCPRGLWLGGSVVDGALTFLKETDGK